MLLLYKNRANNNRCDRTNLRYYKKTSSKNNRLNKLKLNTYFSIAVIFNDLKQFDSTSYYNTIGVLKSLEFKDSIYKNYFKLNQGVNLFKKGEYSEALDSLNKSISTLKRINDKPNLAMAYFYIAKVYDKTFNSKKTIVYFHKVDSIFRINKDVHPKLRETYERLIRYYENIGDIGDIENQLEYVNQLISLDSILHENEVYLNKEIIREYDIPILISEKENIINILKEKETEIKNYIYWLLALILIMILGFYYQFDKRKIYKRRFNEIMKRENDDKIQHFVNKSVPKDLNISESLIERILIELEQFEKQKEFLNENISLNSLAKKIKTNANYLSKIVNLYKEKSFIHYINNLRIDYAVQELKNNTIFRKYTLKAIANEVGFKKGESFSNAFFKRTGIKPSFFIKELSKTEKD